MEQPKVSYGSYGTDAKKTVAFLTYYTKKCQEFGIFYRDIIGKRAFYGTKSIFIQKNSIFIQKKKTKKRSSPITTDRKSKKKTGSRPDAKFRKEVFSSPQVAMSCMSQSNLIDRGNCQLSLYS
jgi:hypothetical protein